MAFADNDTAELACTYAALILHDDNVAITQEKLSSVLDAANVKVQPFWTSLYARVLADKNLDDLITNVGGGAAPAGGAAAGGDAPAAAAAKEAEPEPEPEEESDEDMGFGLFD